MRKRLSSFLSFRKQPSTSTQEITVANLIAAEPEGNRLRDRRPTVPATPSTLLIHERQQRRHVRHGSREDASAALPRYSEDPGADELVLRPQRPSISISREGSDSRIYNSDLNEEPDYPQETSFTEGEPAAVAFPTSSPAQSIHHRQENSNYSSRPQSFISPPSNILNSRPRAISDTVSFRSQIRSSILESNSPSRIQNAIPIYGAPIQGELLDYASSQLSVASPNSVESSLGFSNDRPGLSTSSISSHSVMASNIFLDPTPHPPDSPTRRRRASTLKNVFNHARQRSSSLFSEGRTRRISTASLNISAPLQHTLVTTNLQIPRNGLTASQLTFISSRDSLGVFGCGPGADDPPAFSESPNDNSMRSSTDDPPAYPFAPTLSATNVSSRIENIHVNTSRRSSVILPIRPRSASCNATPRRFSLTPYTPGSVSNRPYLTKLSTSENFLAPPQTRIEHSSVIPELMLSGPSPASSPIVDINESALLMNDDENELTNVELGNLILDAEAEESLNEEPFLFYVRNSRRRAANFSTISEVSVASTDSMGVGSFTTARVLRGTRDTSVTA